MSIREELDARHTYFCGSNAETKQIIDCCDKTFQLQIDEFIEIYEKVTEDTEFKILEYADNSVAFLRPNATLSLASPAKTLLEDPRLLPWLVSIKRKSRFKAQNSNPPVSEEELYSQVTFFFKFHSLPAPFVSIVATGVQVTSLLNAFFFRVTKYAHLSTSRITRRQRLRIYRRKHLYTRKRVLHLVEFFKLLVLLCRFEESFPGTVFSKARLLLAIVKTFQLVIVK
jgi:hypothetical protein